MAVDDVNNQEINTVPSDINGCDVKVKKKRGRKPNPNKLKMYFSDKEEDAFKEYISSNDDMHRNKIFNDVLYPAFSKMVESIIRRYTLFKPGEDFTDTFNDVMSHLMSKVDKFDPMKCKKAYSYCGTICKNYALHERQKAQDRMQNVVSYEVFFNETNPDNRSIEEKYFDDFNLHKEAIKESANRISKMIESPSAFGLNHNDVKVGYALVEILNNWDDIFTELESKKYNKSQVDLFIKDFTSLNTKQIRESKKKFAVVYFKIKKQILDKD